MDYITLIGIAVGLAMDAFAVSITNGAAINKNVTAKFTFKLAFSFGLFQALMPMIGWIIGKAGENLINAIDHWIALILLSYLGINMIIESKKTNENAVSINDISFKSLIAFSVATSIDALATGVILPSTVGAQTIGLMLISVGIIGLITFVLCYFGVYIGKNFGKMCSSKVQIIGGLVLIGIGIKIFIEDVFFM
jgi:putative Mn2+ efflux pump MntP